MKKFGVYVPLKTAENILTRPAPILYARLFLVHQYHGVITLAYLTGHHYDGVTGVTSTCVQTFTVIVVSFHPKICQYFFLIICGFLY